MSHEVKSSPTHCVKSVTSVRLASSAISILLKGRTKFDLLVENINSPDKCGYKLLQVAMQMKMPLILLLDEDDYVFTKRALEYGVLLCITKPVPLEIAKYLWQLVLREKIREMKKMERLRELKAPKRLRNGVGEEGRANGCSSDNNSLNENQKSKKKIKSSSTADQDEEGSLEHENTVRFRGKFWIEWTQELHEKFVYAIKRLGEGRCYPRAILELMNVPGLTRMQVASHLQKCRRGNWQHPIDRKIKNATPLTISGKSCPAKVKRFGSMPLLDNNPQIFSNVKENDQGQVLIKEDNVSGYYSEGISLAGCHSKLHIEPKDSNGCKPFSDVGVETTNMNSIGPNSDISNEKLVLDAVSVATAANNKASGNEEYFEFSNMDSVIQSLYASEQESVDNERSGDALDLDQDNEVSVVLDAEKEPDYCEGQKLEE